MNKSELEKLEDKKEKPATKFQIYVGQFSVNEVGRTLLYGYTCDRDTFHVYLRRGTVFLYTYSYKEPIDQAKIVCEFSSYDELVPNKRLYPECCDYDFCVFLKEHGLILPFTTFNDRRETQQYYGTMPDLYTDDVLNPQPLKTT